MTPEEKVVWDAAYAYVLGDEDRHACLVRLFEAVMNLPLDAVPEARLPMVEASGTITQALREAAEESTPSDGERK